MYRTLSRACRAMVWVAAGALVAAGIPRQASSTPASAPHADVRAIDVIVHAGADDVETRLRRLSPVALDEVVWLARCMYSESDRAHEQELVAWVVRNRVETHYRGRSYREVILEDRQFSAFNEPTKRREHILSLSASTPLLSWRRTLEIALDVYQASASARPFSQTVRHFYSPISMVGGKTPHWADDEKALSSARLGVDRRRFIFFDDVDAHLAGTDASGLSAGDGSEVSGRKKDGGFTIKLPKPSGKVGRPRRPSVNVPRSERRL